MRVLSEIEPKKVMEYFEDLCRIPHGSSNTKAVSDYCVNFAKKHGFTYYQDNLNNVIIICPASNGYENAPAVIIQGHLDMVCEKEHGYDFDFTKDALRLKVDGDFISAEGTTLGGDDGIAVAMALAVMADDEIPHPEIEAVFTVDEETGMTGASAIDLSMLKGKTLLNIDSEEEGVLTVSCAGGSCTKSIIPVKYSTQNGNIYKIIIDGLVGGHSGVEINKGRGNANILMGRFLYAVSKTVKMNIAELEGGMKDNAIPLSATAVIVCDGDICDTVEKYNKIFKNEYKNTDANVNIRVKYLGSYSRKAVDEKSTKRIVSYLMAVPNGIQNMSSDIEGLVQTSLNLGILRLNFDEMSACFSVRSSLSSEKQRINASLEALSEAFGGYVEISGDYPAWEYKKDSKLRTIMTDVYKEQYGCEPKIEAIHAGLECGIFCGKIDGLDCVSFGPNLLEIHTVRERMSISSVQRVWSYLKEVLKRLK